MTIHIVRVDGAGPGKVAAGDEAVDLVTRGRKKNVIIQPDAYVRATLNELPARLRDLYLIAGALCMLPMLGFSGEAFVTHTTTLGADPLKCTLEFMTSHFGVAAMSTLR